MHRRRTTDCELKFFACDWIDVTSIDKTASCLAICVIGDAGKAIVSDKIACSMPQVTKFSVDLRAFVESFQSD